LKKRILITGSAGMLGATLVEMWQSEFDVFATDKSNFSGNPTKNFMPFDLLSNSYEELIQWAEPDMIVHCAAITDVDFCEKNPDQAMLVNSESVKKFLNYGINARLIFISSEAVFPDGLSMASEKDQTAPDTIYGLSKELGEKYIQTAGNSHIAIRTTILGKNINASNQGFIEWILNSVKNAEKITLFGDAFFTPISTWHLGDEMAWIMNNNLKGIVHIAGQEPISKYDLGIKICKGLNLDLSLIQKGSIDDIHFKAKRSKDQTIDSSYYQLISKRTLPTIDKTVELLIQNFKDYANV
jgi:dTDP-4-dehydrorhamnose reductase